MLKIFRKRRGELVFFLAVFAVFIARVRVRAYAIIYIGVIFRPFFAIKKILDKKVKFFSKSFQKCLTFFLMNAIIFKLSHSGRRFSVEKESED